jgi:hypothetical protein
VVYITSSSGRVTAYCSLVDKGSLTLYGALIVVLVSIALASSSYFLIRSLIDVPRARF